MASAAAQDTSKRLDMLDVLRGFALCGILFVNMPPTFNAEWPQYAAGHMTVHLFYDLFIQQRFFPLFSLLFGIGFALLWFKIEHRRRRPRLILLRRFALLLLLGILHQLLQPGEALLPYAICALLLLLPLTFLPRRWFGYVTLIGGAVLTMLSLWYTGGGITLIPGIFLLGATLGTPRSGKAAMKAAPPQASAGTELPLIAALERFAWWQPAAAGFGIIAGSLCVWLAFTNENYYRSETFMAATGLLLMLTYACSIVTLAHSSIGPVIRQIFRPLGKMALTNYLGATVLMTAIKLVTAQAGWVWDSSQKMWLTMTALCFAILLLQWIGSVLWLTKFKQGPLEQLWRRVSYWGDR